MHPGPIDVYLLDQVQTSGLAYDDRDALAHDVRERMQTVMDDLYLNRK
jgi:hypothetical protein